VQVETNVKVPLSLLYLEIGLPDCQKRELRKRVEQRDRKSDQGKTTLLMIFFFFKGVNALRHRGALPKQMVQRIEALAFC
jgi:hypothetical protein